jgi:hypothetical protein
MASWLRCSRAGCGADDGATNLARRQGLRSGAAWKAAVFDGGMGLLFASEFFFLFFFFFFFLQTSSQQPVKGG